MPDENEGPFRWNEPSFRIGLEERLLLAAAVALAEAVDLSVGVELAHLARPERVGHGRDLEADTGTSSPSTSRVSFDVTVERLVHSFPVAESTKITL